VNGAKLAALGLRIRNGCSYHGLSINIDMDLAPFSRINPCGYAGMAVTQLRDLLGPGLAGATLLQDTAAALTTALAARLGYSLVEDAETSI
jgi:lipoyl(octanoyl) transferase